MVSWGEVLPPKKLGISKFLWEEGPPMEIRKYGFPWGEGSPMKNGSMPASHPASEPTPWLRTTVSQQCRAAPQSCYILYIVADSNNFALHRAIAVLVYLRVGSRHGMPSLAVIGGHKHTHPWILCIHIVQLLLANIYLEFCTIGVPIVVCTPPLSLVFLQSNCFLRFKNGSFAA